MPIVIYNNNNNHFFFSAPSRWNSFQFMFNEIKMKMENRKKKRRWRRVKKKMWCKRNVFFCFCNFLTIFFVFKLKRMMWCELQTLRIKRNWKATGNEVAGDFHNISIYMLTFFVIQCVCVYWNVKTNERFNIGMELISLNRKLYRIIL